MKPHVLLSVIGVLLAITSPSPVYVTVSGVTVHFPLPVLAAAAVALACLAAALILVRILYGAMRPCARTRTA